jgi:uncharacterized membrane protein
MPNQQLVDYVKRSLQAGYPESQVRQALLQQGWRNEDIQDALNYSNIPGMAQNIPEPKSNIASDDGMPAGGKHRLLAGLCYLLVFLNIIGIIIDIIIYYTTKSRFTKFHASQACWLMVVVAVIEIFLFPSMMFGGLGIISTTLYISLAIDLIFVIMAIASFAGKKFKIPVVSRLVGEVK